MSEIGTETLEKMEQFDLTDFADLLPIDNTGFESGVKNVLETYALLCSEKLQSEVLDANGKELGWDRTAMHPVDMIEKGLVHTTKLQAFGDKHARRGLSFAFRPLLTPPKKKASTAAKQASERQLTHVYRVIKAVRPHAIGKDGNRDKVVRVGIAHVATETEQTEQTETPTKQLPTSVETPSSPTQSSVTTEAPPAPRRAKRTPARYLNENDNHEPGTPQRSSKRPSHQKREIVHMKVDDVYALGLMCSCCSKKLSRQDLSRLPREALERV